MRKIVLIVTALMMTTVVWATVPKVRVDVNCTPTADPNTILVAYKVADVNQPADPNRVRAFALDINVNGSAIITDVNDKVSPYYKIYPGSIVIINGEVNNVGTAVADYNDYPADTKPGIGFSGVTVEMGALYSPPGDGSPNAPPVAGSLLKFTVAHSCGSTVTITQNAIRGGVVLTSPATVPDFNSLGYTFAGPCGPTVCFPSSDPNYNQWLSVNSPNCWCYPRQCHGDSDNKSEAVKGKGNYYVHFNDLDKLMANWKNLDPNGSWHEPNICADFSHTYEVVKGQGNYRVHFKDLDILMAYWNVLEPPQGPGVPPNCPRN